MPATSELFLNLVNNSRIPLSQATGSVFNTGANASVGLVPAPPNLVFPPNFFLRADGTWAQVDVDSISANTGLVSKVLLNTSITSYTQFPNIFAANSQYSCFELVIQGAQPISGNPGGFFLMRLVNAGNANTANAGNFYYYSFFEAIGSNSAAGGSANNAFWTFSNGDINDGGYGMTATVRIYSAFNASNTLSQVSTITYMTSTSTYLNTAGNLENFWLNGMFNTGVAVNGFALGFNTGGGFANFRSCLIRLIGVC